MLRINRLSLQGFKSFAQYSKFEPHYGITAIVGPNGSGKSNLVDALAFVIGESQQKLIRTSRIEDVIFAGNNELSKADFTEVKLELLDLDKGDEYFITRRLFVGGASEYLLNAKSVRLKELSSLLVEHNLEGEGSFIISQGEVEKQLVSTPNELREWFNDVLGISNLLEKRKSTLNKIEKNRENLRIIKNLINEFENQIDNLQLQATDARRYRQLKNLEQLLEYKECQLDVSNLQSELNRIEDEQSNFVSNYDKLIEEIKISVNNLNNIKQILSECEILKQSKLEQFTNRRIEFEQVKSQFEQIRLKKQSLENDINQTSLKIENCLVEEKKLNELLKDTETELNNTEDLLTLTKNEIEKYNIQLSSIRSELHTINQEHIKCKLSIEHLEKILNENRKDLQRSNEIYQSLKNRIEKLIKENELIKIKQASLNISQLYDEIKAGQKEIDILNKSLENINNVLQIDQEKYEKTRNELNLLENELSKKSGEYNRLVEEENNSTERTRLEILEQLCIEIRPAKDLCEYSNEHLPLIELYFDSFINSYVITENELSLIQSSYLINSLPPTNFILIKDVDELKDLIDLPFIKGPRAVLEAFNANQIELNSNYVRFNERYIRIGVGSSSVQDSLKRYKRIKEISIEMNYLKNTISDLKNSFFITDKNIKDNTEKRNQIQKEISGKSLIIKNKLLELRTLEENNKSYLEQLNRNQGLIPELVSSKDQTANDILQYEETIKRFEEDLGALKIDYEKVNNLLNEKSKTASEFENKYKDLQRQYDNYQKQFNKLHTDLQVIKTNLENTQINLKGLINQKNEMVAQLNKVNNEYIQIEKDPLLANGFTLNNYKTEIERIDAMINDYKNNIDEFSNKIRRLELEKVQLESKNYRYKEVADSIKQQISVLEEKIENFNLEMPASTIIEIEIPNMELPDEVWEIEKVDLEKINKRKINNYKQRIERALSCIGNVNLLAEPQLNELKLKLESYQKEILDLEKAQEDLLSSELELKEEAIKRFKTRLKETEKNFQNIFKTIFGNGSCSIKLQDPNDILYSTIEIEVQLPGKKTTSLHLLSGGERSLLFIALFLAANSVASCGFLILDEVDASLDDANIIKFKKLIKEWSKKIQIILVTHNRATMEVADKLIGVVNQPKGVSIIVPVELSEAVKKFHYN